MGAGLDKDASNHFDKRTLRIMYANEFARALRKESVRRGKAAGKENGGASVAPEERGDCTAIIRKRPIFEHEQAKGEFDVIQCQDSTIAIYNCQRHMNGQDLFMTRSSFKFPAVYSDKDSTEKIYEADIAPAVREWSAGRSGCTLFMYGQTGSGKSYTIGGLLKLASREAFSLSSQVSDVTVSVFEIAGGKCYDLLNPIDAMDESEEEEAATRKHQEVFLRDSEDGEVCVRGLKEFPCTTTEEVLDAIQRADESRATQSTTANDQSSRSHAVYQLRSSQGALMRFVDLAGSERNRDSMFHTEARQKESIEINVSLNSLKECIRLRIEQEQAWRKELEAHREKHPSSPPALKCKSSVHLPFRRSALTRVLKASLQPRVPEGMFVAGKEAEAEERHKTILIATVSPAASDTEHSMSTLQHASLMALSGSKSRETKIEVESASSLKKAAEAAKEKEMVNPKDWTAEEVLAWVKSIVGTPPDLRMIVKNFKTVTGKEVTRFTRNMFEERCCGNKVAATKLFQSISAMKRKIDQQKQKERRQLLQANAANTPAKKTATKARATSSTKRTAATTSTAKKTASRTTSTTRSTRSTTSAKTAGVKKSTAAVTSRVDSGMRSGTKRKADEPSKNEGAPATTVRRKMIRPPSSVRVADL